MTIELGRLQVDFTSVDINNNYTTYSKLRNKSRMPDADEQNNLPPTEDSNNTHSDEAATPLNLHLPLRDSSELITFSNARQSSTKMQCNFYCL